MTDRESADAIVARIFQRASAETEQPELLAAFAEAHSNGKWKAAELKRLIEQRLQEPPSGGRS